MLVNAVRQLTLFYPTLVSAASVVSGLVGVGAGDVEGS